MITMVKRFYDKNNVDKILQKRLVRNFIDLLILLEISRSPLISGYNIVVAFQRKFNLFISPGTIYLTLYKLERDGLIKGEDRKRKRVYTLTSKGKRFIENVSALQENVAFILSKILVDSSHVF